MSDLISREAAIIAIRRTAESQYKGEQNVIPADYEAAIMELPTIQPTMYGYEIEHLALIAKEMELENIPPWKVLEVLTDAKRVVDIILTEQKQIIERELQEWI